MDKPQLDHQTTDLVDTQDLVIKVEYLVLVIQDNSNNTLLHLMADIPDTLAADILDKAVTQTKDTLVDILPDKDNTEEAVILDKVAIHSIHKAEAGWKNKKKMHLICK